MNTRANRTDWVGQAVDGRFVLLEWLGGTEWEGVFRTELQGPEARKAAIRIIPADVEDAQSQLDRWVQAMNLSHPHLMHIFHSGRWQNDGVELLYVVTEYAEETLAQVIPERPLTAEEAGEMLNPVLDALSYLHGQGLVHGHLNPSNIMVVDNQLKLPVENVYRAGKLREPAGQLRVYDAPETAIGAMTPAADVWSLGITLIEALTQQPPEWDRSGSGDPIVSESVPQPFANIGSGCVRYQPAKRISLRDIRTLLDPPPPIAEPVIQVDKQAPVAIPPPVEIRKAAPAWRGPLPVLIAGALIVFGVLVLLLMRSHRSQPEPETQAQSSPATVVPPPTQAQAPAPATIAPPPTPPAAAPKAEDARGEVVERVMPDLLPSAQRSIQGKVEVRVRVAVTAAGAVSNATFDSPGKSRYFANKALDAARSWKFKPAQVDGQPVASEWTLQFRFRRGGTEVTPLEVSPR
jgi:TonB family protein